jgi:Heterokaryon incompatibility protein (HET)
VQSGISKSKAGYEKIRRYCEKADMDGFLYCWIDTCCIDKISSAELSEAINSMYEWYRVADVCYVYLADVPATLKKEVASLVLRKSRWFTCGWTFQELIAPLIVIFFNKDWGEIGTKESLKFLVFEITTITKEVLQDANEIDGLSVAQKMSWVSKRETARVEDIAYCLLGIFRVSMPMLYGEGNNAFIRLQEEIMKNTHDHTIFAWTNDSDFNNGLLATNPTFFKDSGNIVQIKNQITSPFSLTNKGINLNLLIQTFECSPICLAVLDCRDGDWGMGIALKRESDISDVFKRVLSNEQLKIDFEDIPKFERENIYVKQESTFSIPHKCHRYDIDALELEEAGISSQNLFHGRRTGQISTSIGKALAVYFTDRSGDGFVVLLKHQMFSESNHSPLPPHDLPSRPVPPH